MSSLNVEALVIPCLLRYAIFVLLCFDSLSVFFLYFWLFLLILRNLFITIFTIYDPLVLRNSRSLIIS